MSNGEPILTVYFSRRWAGFILIAGLLITFLVVLVVLLTGKVMWQQLFLSIFIVISGLLYWKGKFFEVYTNRIKVFALFQFVSRSFSVDTIDHLIITKRFVLGEKNGKKIKIRIGKLMANPNDWKKFERLIRQSDLSQELHD